MLVPLTVKVPLVEMLVPTVVLTAPEAYQTTKTVADTTAKANENSRRENGKLLAGWRDRTKLNSSLSIILIPMRNYKSAFALVAWHRYL